MYGFYREVTIDKSKCGSADTTNFVFTIAGTYSYLATVVNGGKVQNSNGYDIGVFVSNAIVTKLDWAMLEYDPVTGRIRLKCRIATLTVATDSKIYLAYGDASISTFQGNVNGVYDSGYVLAASMPNGTTLSAADSTANANNGTITGATATTLNGSGAANFDGANDKIDFGSASSLDNLVQKSFSAIIKLNTVSTTTDMVFIAKVWDTSGYGGWWFYRRRDSDATHGGKLKFVQAWTLSTFESAIWRGTTKLANTTDIFHIAFTYDNGSTSNNPIIYINGVADTIVNEQAVSGTVKSDAPYALLVGERGYGDLDLNAIISDVTLSNVIRNADWALAEANNLLSPSTFYSIGSEVVIGTVYTLSLAGGQATGGEIYKKTKRTLVGVQDEVGELYRKAKRTFVGTQDETGILSSKTKKSLVGAMDTTGILTNRTRKLFDGALDMTGILALKTRKALVGVIDMTGILATGKRMFISLAGSMSTTGVLSTVVVPTVISAYNNFKEWWLRRRYH